MKKSIFIVSAFFLCVVANAQKAPVKFGDVPMDLIKQTVYEKDTSASAYFAMDYGKSEIKYSQSDGFQVHFERVARIKVLSKDGLDWADFGIGLYHVNDAGEKLIGLRGVTYNLENGKVVESKLKNDGIFKEKRDANVDVTKFTMPNVKVGSVIEVTYAIVSDFLFNFQDWDFQHTIPAAWSEYRTAIPEYFNYDRYTQGYLSMSQQGQTETSSSINFSSVDRSNGGSIESENVNYRTTNSRWVIQDVPAFKSEPFMTSTSDYMSKIKFELTHVAYPNRPVKSYRGTWAVLNSSLLENEYLGKAGGGAAYLNRIVEEKTAGLTDPRAKVAALYNFVRENTNWDEQNSIYCMKDFKKVIEEKKGSAAEINLLLVALLQRADLIANPVLLSTRSHGFVRENMAISSQFNYLIAAVKIGDNFELLDATDHSLPINLLPKRCLNGKGYMLSSSAPAWLPLVAGVKSRDITNIDLVLQADGGLKGKVAFNREGYYAQEMRKNYLSKGEADYCKEVASKNLWELHKSEFGNVNKLAEPVSETHELTIAEQTQTGGDLIYINPLLFHRKNENPFKAEERHYPVDFGHTFQELYTGKISIPEGFTVEELPKPKVIALPNNAGRYVYSISQIGSNLAVTSQFSMNLPLFNNEDYAGLREFYAQVVAKQAEQIVLKKK